RLSHDLIASGKQRDHVHLSRILFCTDFSENSERALNYAISLTAAYDAEISLLHVLDHLLSSANLEEATSGATEQVERLIPTRGGAFTPPTDYALANTEISGATSALERYAAPWNSTTAADFAAPDNVTNVDLARWPGNVTLAATSGPSTLLSLQPAPAVGEDTWLDQQNVNMNHGSDTTLILDGFNPQSRPILRFDLSSI